MSFFNSFNTAASGLTAQGVRMDVIQQNIANIETTRTAAGGPYQRQAVIFEERGAEFGGFRGIFNEILRPPSITQTPLGERPPIRLGLTPIGGRNVQTMGGVPFEASSGVRVRNIISDPTPGPRSFDPTHPDADEYGYVNRPNVNIVAEMTNMISASRSYEANMTSINVTRAMINRTLELSGR
ncbi:MAG: flagellar basal body rod protein FlgC [Defluviitaleaceae bacterium]|nr:flagellar basal body rod protein FlgC [Defluviitaleaceae bacterium]